MANAGGATELESRRLPSWSAAIKAKLLDQRRDGVGWGYRRGTTPAIEASATAALALLAYARAGQEPAQEAEAAEIAQTTARWIAQQQLDDGALAVRPGLKAPNWPTPCAIWLWNAAPGFDPEIRRALSWLLETEGVKIPRQGNEPTAHDSMIPGWPWVADTHSWLEPTSMAVLALRCRVLEQALRAQDGLRLIRDRALPKGGWNYGNTAVFNTELRAQPAPTGLALAALAGTPAPEAEIARIVDRASRYLLETLPETNAPCSLGWGVLGLTAWGLAPQASQGWIERAAVRLLERENAADPWRLSHLLLAVAAPTALPLFGSTMAAAPAVPQEDRQ